MLDWYVVETNPRAEFAVRDALRQLDVETILPYGHATVRHARRARTVKVSLYGNYVLVGLNGGQSFYQITTMRGVYALVADAGGPLRVPEPVVDEIRSMGDEDGFVEGYDFDEVLQRRRFRSGERVQLTESAGSAAGFFARIEVDAGDEIRLWLERSEGEWLTTVKPDAVKIASPARRSIAKNPSY